MTHFGAATAGSSRRLRGIAVPRSVPFKPRLVVNSVRAALGLGRGRARGHAAVHLSCRRRMQDGSLQILLATPSRAAAGHLLMPEGRISVPKVRAFIDFAAPAPEGLHFARLSGDGWPERPGLFVRHAEECLPNVAQFSPIGERPTE